MPVSSSPGPTAYSMCTPARGRQEKRGAPTPGTSPTGEAETKEIRGEDDGLVGMIEGFVLDEPYDLGSMELTPDLEIDWAAGPFDEQKVREGKCKDINTMMEHES